MDIIESARRLGKDIQADDRYKAYVKAQEAAQSDEHVAAVSKQLESIQAEFEKTATEDPENDEKLEKLHSEYIQLFQEVNKEPLLMAVLEARGNIDNMMNDVMQIIYLCLNGEDPDTCELSAENLERMQNSILGI